jgi:hypothetical protein
MDFAGSEHANAAAAKATAALTCSTRLRRALAINYFFEPASVSMAFIPSRTFGFIKS